jgi:DNA-directed RNA polymerase subunit omega
LDSKKLFTGEELMDIISLPIEIDKEKIDSRFRLVIISSQRAIELSKGVKPRIETKLNKITSNAILESLSGEIDFLTGEDASDAFERAEKLDFRKWITEKKRPVEDLSDIEKDLKIYLHDKESPEKALDYLFEEERNAQDIEPPEMREEASEE